MKILLTGRNGQVGWELERTLAPLGEVIATDRVTLDVADLDAIRRFVREAKPDLIVNAAAYTAVDRAESEPALAMRVNGEAPGVLAEEAKRLGALLVHYSTDYVFDGTKSSPYAETDAPNPLNVYGRTKLAGERAVEAVACRHITLRTSWVYASRGRNFLLTILRVAREREELRVVSDQLGSPTPASLIASVTAQLLSRPSAEGLFHLAAGGETTWHGFAEAIVRDAGLQTRVLPIASSEYPSAARRPMNSRLDTALLRTRCGVDLPDWRSALAAILPSVGPQVAL